MDVVMGMDSRSATNMVSTSVCEAYGAYLPRLVVPCLGELENVRGKRKGSCRTASAPNISIDSIIWKGRWARAGSVFSLRPEYAESWHNIENGHDIWQIVYRNPIFRGTHASKRKANRPDRASLVHIGAANWHISFVIGDFAPSSLNCCELS